MNEYNLLGMEILGYNIDHTSVDMLWYIVLFHIQDNVNCKMIHMWKANKHILVWKNATFIS